MKASIIALVILTAAISPAQATALIDNDQNQGQHQGQHQGQGQKLENDIDVDNHVESENKNYNENDNDNDNYNENENNVNSENTNKNINNVQSGSYSGSASDANSQSIGVNKSENTNTSGASSVSEGSVAGSVSGSSSTGGSSNAVNSSTSQGGASNSTSTSGNSTATSGASNSGASALGGSGGSVGGVRNEVNIKNPSPFPILNNAAFNYNSFGGGVSCASASLSANAFARGDADFGFTVGVSTPLGGGAGRCNTAARLQNEKQQLEVDYLRQQVRALTLQNAIQPAPQVIYVTQPAAPAPDAVKPVAKPDPKPNKPTTGSVRGLW